MLKITSSMALLMICTFAPTALAGNSSAAPANHPTTKPIVLFGNGIGAVRFGATEKSTIAKLNVLLGAADQTTSMQTDANCGLSGYSKWLNVYVTYENNKFVGFEIGGSGSNIVTTPKVATTKGLALGDTITKAKAIYHAAFTTTSAQGGSWAVKTATGKIYGLLTAPPIIGPKDKISLIAAGYVGCPGETP